MTATATAASIEWCRLNGCATSGGVSKRHFADVASDAPMDEHPPAHRANSSVQR
ncbi:MAG: hypothetical protein ACYDB2_04105 [Acidimicrobiales bacterium]